VSGCPLPLLPMWLFLSLHIHIYSYLSYILSVCLCLSLCVPVCPTFCPRVSCCCSVRLQGLPLRGEQLWTHTEEALHSKITCIAGREYIPTHTCICNLCKYYYFYRKDLCVLLLPSVIGVLIV
jgi:hypothetical protein